MTSQVNLKALGLNTSPNQLDVDDGSLTKAKNIIIRRDNVIEPRRGYKLWGEQLGSVNDRAKQLLVYKDRVLRHYRSTIQFQNGINNDETVNFDTFNGSYSEVEEGLRIKSLEANSNLYFTTNKGIKKISAKSDSDLSTSSGYVVDSGVAKALDITAILQTPLGNSSGFMPADSTIGNSPGFMPADSTTAYRVVWGYTDLNDNLLLGTPSEREEVYNTFLPLIKSDLNSVLAALDEVIRSVNQLLGDDNNYLATLGVTASTKALNTRNNAIALAEKIDRDIQYVYMSGLTSVERLSNVVTITFNGGDATEYFTVGDSITVSGFPGTSGSLDGTFAVTAVTTSTATYTKIGSDSNATGFGYIINNTTNNWVNLFNIDTVSSVSDVVTIDFVENIIATVELYYSIGDYITLENFGTLNSVSLNGIHQITDIDIANSSISFVLASTGTNSTTTFGEIYSGNYQSITEPDVFSSIPNDQQYLSLQNYIRSIIEEIQAEKETVLQSATKVLFFNKLAVTTASNVKLIITIPESITTNYFYQVYRSETVVAGGTDVLTDLSPSDELQQVFEGFVTQAEIDTGSVEFIDITPDAFRGANLYTNANSGEGILQSNTPAPLATDINSFKGYTFYSNTQTRHQRTLDLLGVTAVKGGSIISISAADPTTIGTSSAHGLTTGDNVFIQGTTSSAVNGLHKVTVLSAAAFRINVDGSGAGSTGSWSNSNLEITNESGTINYYSLVTAVSEKNTLTSPAKIDVSGSEYILIKSADNQRQYYVWFNTGSSVDPEVVGAIGVPVRIIGLTTATEVMGRIYRALVPYSYDFNLTYSGADSLVIENVEAGYTDPIFFSDVATNFTNVRNTVGVGQELKQLTQTITTVADVAGNLASTAITVNAPFNRDNSYFWFKVDGTGTDPDIEGRNGYVVEILTNATEDAVAAALAEKMSLNISNEFNISVIANSVLVEAIGFGDADFIAPVSGNDPGFTIVVNQLGILTVEKSSNISPSISTEQTARSLIEAINKNKSALIYAYYVSGLDDVPGQMFLESRSLGTTESPFYINGGNSSFGAIFNPDISSGTSISSITTGIPSTITSNSHGYANGNKILITGSNSVPSIDGIHTVRDVTVNTFTINKEVETAGDVGYITLKSNSEFSDNEDRPNRIYYSKFQQPEAVPIVNFLDVGAKDKDILRIYPLRDSLFVFKEDGIYRISGETSPFNISLFDGSAVLLAADSIDDLENVIYGWFRAGITQVTESGVNAISRSIDDVILPTASNVFTNFSTATFGVGYESDQSYTVWTVSQREDTVATIAYRYHTLTSTWTTYDKTNTCGINNSKDDLIYLGAGDTNYLEQERKTYDRRDYADREIMSNINSGLYNKANKTLTVSSLLNLSVGDVVYQKQYLTIFAYNGILAKLDLDGGPADNNYLSTLAAVAGDNLRTNIELLAQKLDSDSGVTDTDYASTISIKSGTVSNITGITESSPVEITSTAHGLINNRQVLISGSDSTPTLNGTHGVTVIDADTFSIPVNTTNVGIAGNFTWSTQNNNFLDIQTCYNNIISKLNTDTGVNFSNYSPVTSSTELESIILSINKSSKELTLSFGLDFTIGPIVIFNGFETEVEYCPITMQDPLGWKHLREATVMFQKRAFTRASVEFATDLLPEFIKVVFDSDGNGAFGIDLFGSGYFGGGSNSSPFRTYVPKQCQRCRYMLINYKHSVARESYSIYGISLTGQISQSEKAYK